MWKCLISRFVETQDTGHRRREHRTTTLFFLSLTWYSPLEFNPRKIANIWRIQRDGMSAIKFEEARYHLLTDVFVLVAVVVAWANVASVYTGLKRQILVVYKNYSASAFIELQKDFQQYKGVPWMFFFFFIGHQKIQREIECSEQ